MRPEPAGGGGAAPYILCVKCDDWGHAGGFLDGMYRLFFGGQALAICGDENRRSTAQIVMAILPT